MMSYLPLRLFAVAMLLFAFSNGALAQESASDAGPRTQPGPGLSLDQRICVGELIESHRERIGAPGIAVAIAQGESLLYEGGRGFANLADSVPVTTETVFRIASVTKPITATAVLQLATLGALDLDAPIQEYCPAFPEKRWPVTAAQLLIHTAGVRHPTDAEDEQTTHYETIEEALAVFAADSLLFEPGTEHRYSTLGYMVLGCAIEGASGMGYMEYLRKHIFEPAGMTSTTRDTVSRTDPRRVVGYRATEEGLAPSLLVDTSFKLAGGGLSATAADLVRFATALFSHRLLDPETTARMLEPAIQGDAMKWGIGWMLPPSPRPIALMNGQQEEATALLVIDLETGMSIAILSNLERSVQLMVPLLLDLSRVLTLMPDQP